MNVQERLLQEKIDPHLTDRNLTELAARAMEHARTAGLFDGGRSTPDVRGYRVLTGGCWNRVVSVRIGNSSGTDVPSATHDASATYVPSVTTDASAADIRSVTTDVTAAGDDVSTTRVASATDVPSITTDASAAGERAPVELVYKICPHEHDERIIREYRVLEAFASTGALPVPTPLWCDHGEILPGTTLVMTKVPGVVMHECYGMLTPDRQARITDRIATDLATLHTRRSHGFGGVELAEYERHARWADFWLPRFDAVLNDASASDAVPPQLVEAAMAVRDEFPRFLSIGPESTMTHYDIWSGNVMIDLHADPPRVSGYIDVPGFYADYARELSFAMMFGVADRRFFARYLQRHRLDDGFAVRAAIYNLKMNIKHVMMYPTQYYYQQGAAECLEVINRAISG
jgi:fructosamine-3-kinase